MGGESEMMHEVHAFNGFCVLVHSQKNFPEGEEAQTVLPKRVVELTVDTQMVGL